MPRKRRFERNRTSSVLFFVDQIRHRIGRYTPDGQRSIISGKRGIGPGRLQDFTALCSAAAHLRNFGEQFSQDTDRPFVPLRGLVVGLVHHQPIQSLKKVSLLSLQSVFNAVDRLFFFLPLRIFTIFFRLPTVLRHALPRT